MREALTTSWRGAVAGGSRLSLILAGSLLCGVPVVLGASGPSPLEELETFSTFSDVDLEKLHAGEILGEPGTLMKFPDGISAETCFVVAVPAAEVATRLKFWDPSLRGTVKTVGFHALSTPCTPEDFRTLSLKPANRPQRWLLEETANPLARKSELNLSQTEAQQLADCVKRDRKPANMSACWATLLLGRARQFENKGFAGIAAYEAQGRQVEPLVHLQALLKEREPVAREFAPLLRQTGLLGSEGSKPLKPFYYWGLYEANRQATLTLGAVYLLPLAESYQLLDVQYYVSGTYYTFATLYQVWPVEIRGRPAALVWRGDFFSTPTMPYTKGVERLAYGAFMLQELRKTIRSFQKNAATSKTPPGYTPPD